MSNVSRTPVVAVLMLQTPMVDPNTGFITPQWIRGFFQGIVAAVNKGLGLDGTALKMPFPQVGVMGGVQATLATPKQWIYQIGADGVPLLSQPSFADLSGTAGIPVVTSGTGVPVAAASDGALYFDTSASPAHGYARLGGVWVQFS